jgi:hypothetical protein
MSRTGKKIFRVIGQTNPACAGLVPSLRGSQKGSYFANALSCFVIRDTFRDAVFL